MHTNRTASRRDDARTQGAPATVPRRPGRILGLVLAIVAASSFVAAEAPRVDAVDPGVGSTTEPTEVRVTGAAIAPGSTLALLDGGPFEAARILFTAGASGVHVDGDRAYVAFYDPITKLGGIRVYDVSDPTAPHRVDTFELGDSGRNVVFTDGYAYMTFLNPYTFIGGMHVVQIDGTERPLLMGSVGPLVDPRGAVVRDDTMFIADSTAGLVIADVSDAIEPKAIAAVDTAGLAWDVAVDGDRAYVADGFGGLAIVDVSDPSSPEPLGGFALPGAFSLGVDVKDGLVYLADFENGLLIFDPNAASPSRGFDDAGSLPGGSTGSLGDTLGTNPTASTRSVDSIGATEPTALTPALIGRYRTGDQATSVEVVGTRAFVGDGLGGLQVLDVSDPTAPRYVGGYSATGSGGYFLEIDVAGDHVYVADLFAGLRVIDVSTAAAPAAVADVPLATTATKIARLDGERAAVLRGGGHLELFDLSRPDAPSSISSVRVADVANDVAIAGDVFWIAAGRSGLVAVDASDTGAPVVVGQAPAVRDALSVAVSGAYAYVGDAARRVGVYDISDPTAPSRIATLAISDDGFDVVVDGDVLYVAADFRGVETFDLSNPAAPVRLGRVDTSGRATEIALAGSIAYVADGNRGIAVIDVSDPSAPSILDAETTLGRANGVSIARAGGTESEALIVADGLQGIAIYDVTDPTRLREVERHDTPGDAWSALGDAARIFVADGRGLRVVARNPAIVQGTSDSDTTLTATIPAGFRGGVYDAVVTSPTGVRGELPNAFAVCASTSLDARLEPLGLSGGGLGDPPDPTALPTASGPIAWTLALGSDAGTEHAAHLRLPPLVGSVGIVPVPSANATEDVIEIEIEPRLPSNLVRLISADPDALAARFDAARDAGFELPRLDDTTYGPLRLTGVLPAGATGPGPRSGGRQAGFRDGVLEVSGPVTYRYTWQDGVLVAADAIGKDTDHLFDVVGAGDGACLATSAVELSQELRAWCTRFDAEFPGVIAACALENATRVVTEPRGLETDGPTVRDGRVRGRFADGR